MRIKDRFIKLIRTLSPKEALFVSFIIFVVTMLVVVIPLDKVTKLILLITMMVILVVNGVACLTNAQLNKIFKE